MQITAEVPGGFVLRQNYPNPFNPSTNFEFGFVSSKVFDVLGREVASLVNEVRPAGVYTVRWDASWLPRGVYSCRLQAGAFIGLKKMVLLKIRAKSVAVCGFLMEWLSESIPSCSIFFFCAAAFRKISIVPGL